MDRRPSAQWLVRQWLAPTLGLLTVGGLVSCDRTGSTYRHEAVSGTVESVRPDTGQLTLRVTGPRVTGRESDRISCLLTSDAEVYINDALRRFEAIEIGDTVELIGYPDPNPRAERFVICHARITRNEPLPPEPDLTPATQATSQPQES